MKLLLYSDHREETSIIVPKGCQDRSITLSQEYAKTKSTVIVSELRVAKARVLFLLPNQASWANDSESRAKRIQPSQYYY
jgi:hypothetical protein